MMCSASYGRQPSGFGQLKSDTDGQTETEKERVKSYWPEARNFFIRRDPETDRIGFMIF